MKVIIAGATKTGAQAIDFTGSKNEVARPRGSKLCWYSNTLQCASVANPDSKTLTNLPVIVAP